ncbi:DUF6705 family protein [Flavobacterium sp.]|uniref:DUF6705 family protein n=1 Tax=Flavobacterium sp. TaxID=239 RepID=UPI00261EFBCA|nr:DUF6705 family protein [Flavobacterium sp.]
MKTLYTTIILLFLNSAFSQNVVPIEDRYNTTLQNGQSYYFKDVNGVFDKFIGTWKYVDGTQTTEIAFFKREHVSSGSENFHDELYARIKYIKNGTVVYNTFPATTPANLYRDHNIYGSSINASDVNRMFRMHYSEPGKGGPSGVLSIEYFEDGGTSKLNWKALSPETTNTFKIPSAMVLIKQP